MADITRLYPTRRHLRSGPTTWIRHARRGRVRHQGVGLAFGFAPRSAVLSEVPLDDRELALVCHARTADHAEVSVPVGVTHRVADPERAVARLDFGIDPASGRWRGNPLESLATLLGELAQEPVLAWAAGTTLDAALAGGPEGVRRAVAARLADDPRLAELGVAVVAVRVLATRAAPDLERALQTPTREAAQARADEATFRRRAEAVEQERAIGENELQSKIGLARREQELVDSRGANARRRAELDAEADRVAAVAEAERVQITGAADAERVRAVRTAEAAGQAALAEAFRDLPAGVLAALAVRELAGRLPEIGQLTLTPDVLTGALARLGAP